MKIKPTLLLALTVFSLQSPPKRAHGQESLVEKVKFSLCSNNQSDCVTISAEHGEHSSFEQSIFLRTPRVTGLGLEKRTFSSAYIDLITGQVLLRERRAGLYLGEWVLDIDTFHVNFYPLK